MNKLHLLLLIHHGAAALQAALPLVPVAAACALFVQYCD
jgi:hypothetical protein